MGCAGLADARVCSAVTRVPLPPAELRVLAWTHSPAGQPGRHRRALGALCLGSLPLSPWLLCQVG